jgi:GMP reductase
MQIINEVKLDFKDVLIRPQRSTLASRSEVSIERTFHFKHTNQSWTGVPIVAANMDTVGNLEMFGALSRHKMLTALHKHYDVDTYVKHFMTGIDPDIAEAAAVYDHGGSLLGNHNTDVTTFTKTDQSQFSFYSMGISDSDYEKFRTVMSSVGTKSKLDDMDDRVGMGKYNKNMPVKMVCVDVANGYTETFVAFIRKLRQQYPFLVIMAGNVVSEEMTQALILAGADIVKVGIGPGSVCTTRKMAGVGFPQLSAIIECANAAHGLDALICADGGCTVPGDINKAFGAGADFVMLGGMLAGTDQSGGELISRWVKTNEVIIEDGVDLGCLNVEQKFKRFYGMSSDTAMNKHNGGVAKYRASEGKTVEVPYRGDVDDTIQGILGGLRSCCTYVGARSLKDISQRTTFIRVTQQINEIFGKS